MMTRNEWLRLKAYINPANLQHQHKPLLLGRRSARNKANHTGAVLRTSRVKPQVGLERVFIKRV